MQTTRIDIYDLAPIPWSRALRQREAATKAVHGQSEYEVTHWLATARADGKPHMTAVGAMWVEDRFYFTSGARTRKSRDLAVDPRCVVAVSLPDLDLVVEGTAAKVTDTPTLERLAALYDQHGWPAEAKDGAITAPYSAPSAGPAPWDLYEMTPEVAFGVATAEPHGATRWRFDTDG